MFGDQLLDPVFLLTILVTFVVAITVHEFMHAWTAYQLGDDTAYHLGRISLNPAVHFDPLGAFMFLLIALGFPAIAWGKPVPVNVYRLRPLGRLGREGSMALVAFAGPLSNVVMAAAAALSLRLNDGAVPAALTNALFVFMSINIGLAAFNMIPVPPLDGYRILSAVLPAYWRPLVAGMERYGFAILLVLILTGSAFGTSLIGAMVGPVYDALVRLVSFA